MKHFVVVLAIFIFAGFAYFEYMNQDRVSEWFPEREALPEDTQEVDEEPPEENVQEEISWEDPLIGLSADEVLTDFGDPDRTDLSSFGYEWYIYEDDDEQYVQIGIESGEVVTAFFIGSVLEELPYDLPKDYTEMDEQYGFSEQVSVSFEGGQYQYQLSEEDLRMRPLFEYEEGVWIQAYFDQFTEELSSVRILNDEVLVMQRPYSVQYRGVLPEPPELSEQELEEVARGQEQQIFAVTNVMRVRHGLDTFDWDEEISEVAYKHSEDMQNHQFFSHVSPNTGDLSDRIEAGGIRLRLAGENIAAHYVDGLAAVEGWLNSEGHRVNLLHEEFTHLGVGVYEDYYTQNFMTPWLP